MPPSPANAPPPRAATARVRIAAAGDVHCDRARAGALAEAFAAIDGTVDLILLAGDLTTHGEPEQAALVAGMCRQLTTPVITVLGNHDLHSDCRDEVVGALEAGNITVLDRGFAVRPVGGQEVGIVGIRGFVGGFPGSHLANFGERILRDAYAETSAEVEALEAGLRAVAHCSIRIVLLHYAPTAETLEGEPQGIWMMLGSDRFAAPVLAHEPDLVLHGHAHAGSLRGAIGPVPVYNVAVTVMQQDFWTFELPDTGAR
jgi:Icc-related predicted phosphoesterase